MYIKDTSAASHAPATRPASRLIIVGLIAAFVLAPPNHANAQCAAIRDLETAIAAAPTVFVGEVVDVGTDDRIAQMQVLSVWKGRDLVAHVEVRGAATKESPPSATDRRFEAGATYLVIPENSRDPFLASACSATQEYSAAPNLIPQLYQDATGASTGRPPVGASAIDAEAAISQSVLPLLGALALIATTWGAILWLRSREPDAPEKSTEKPEGEPKPRKVRKRSLQRDSRRSGTTARRLVKQNRRKWRVRRRKRDQGELVSSTTASGSTDTS